MSEERLVFSSDRPDGRFLDIEGFMHQYLKDLKPVLEFDPKMNPEHFAGWQMLVAEKLRELLQFPESVPEQPPPQMLWAEPRDGYELQKWEAYPEPLKVVTFLVLVPDGIAADSPGAAVMCFPGSTTTKELLAGEPEIVPWAVENKHPIRNQMARHCAEAGLVAVAVDHPDIGERSCNCFGNSRYEWGVHAIWTGRNFEGTSVFEKFCILDWLRQQDYVDRSRIAVSGHSLGALPALHMGVLDPSLAAVVWNDFVSNWRRREVFTTKLRCHLGHYIPGMQQWFDYVDLMASLAPRSFLVTEGGRTPDLEKIAKAWDITGQPQHYSVFYYPKYATPDKRPHDHDDLFEGITDDEYYEYANVDVPAHCFKENIAVPWLSKVLGIPEETNS